MDSGQRLHTDGGETAGLQGNYPIKSIAGKQTSPESLIFRRINTGDIHKLAPFFDYSQNRTCDYTVGTVFMWRDYFNTEYAIHNSTCIFKVRYINGKTAFTMPLGPDVPGALEKINAFTRAKGIPLLFCTATSGDLTVYGKYFEISAAKEPDWGDYLYRASDLATLSGRRYNGQRNHINFFKRNNPCWGFEDLNTENAGETEVFYKNSSLIDSKPTGIFVEEQNKVFEVLQNYDLYGQIGGIIRAGGDIVAFAFGEILKDTLYVHAEKADTSVRGSYQMIVHEFAKRYASESVKYINREEDMGDEGLRTSKMSYHPCEIIEKYTVSVINQ